MGRRAHGLRGRGPASPCGPPASRGRCGFRGQAGWCPSRDGDAPWQVSVGAARRRGHLAPRSPGHERPTARTARGRTRREASADQDLLRRRRRHRAALRRPAHLRRPLPPREHRRGTARHHRAHRPRPAGPGLRRRRVPHRAASAPYDGQARPARPVTDQRGRQHLRGRGALARQAALRPADRHPHPPQVGRAARPRPRRDERGAGAGRHELRQPLRERERRVRLLRTARSTPTAARTSRATAAVRRCGAAPG